MGLLEKVFNYVSKKRMRKIRKAAKKREEEEEDGEEPDLSTPAKQRRYFEKQRAVERNRRLKRIEEKELEQDIIERERAVGIISDDDHYYDDGEEEPPDDEKSDILLNKLVEGLGRGLAQNQPGATTSEPIRHFTVTGESGGGIKTPAPPPQPPIDFKNKVSIMELIRSFFTEKQLTQLKKMLSAEQTGFLQAQGIDLRQL